MPNVQLDENGLPLGLQALQALTDDSLKGLLRSIGDAGASPLNETGATLSYRLRYIVDYVRGTCYVFNFGLTAANAETFTTTALAANATYTSPTKDFVSSRLGFMLIQAFADVAGTAYIDQSIDGNNWDYSESQAVAAGVGNKLKSAVYARYTRARYVNGATIQATFHFGGRYAIA